MHQKMRMLEYAGQEPFFQNKLKTVILWEFLKNITYLHRNGHNNAFIA